MAPLSKAGQTDGVEAALVVVDVVLVVVVDVVRVVVVTAGGGLEVELPIVLLVVVVAKGGTTGSELDSLLVLGLGRFGNDREGTISEVLEVVVVVVVVVVGSSGVGENTVEEIERSVEVSEVVDSVVDPELATTLMAATLDESGPPVNTRGEPSGPTCFK